MHLSLFVFNSIFLSRLSTMQLNVNNNAIKPPFTQNYTIEMVDIFLKCQIMQILEHRYYFWLNAMSDF